MQQPSEVNRISQIEKEFMTHSPFTKTPPANPLQYLGQAGRWFRSNGRILVLPESEAQPDSEMAPVFSRSDRLVPEGRVLTYTTKDVVDNRISVPAQHSLVRLSKNPETNASALELLEDIKSNRLGGIFCVNWQKAAQRALKLGKSWWTVIPPGEDAVVMLDPQDPFAGQPLMAFRRELDPACGSFKGEKQYAAHPVRLDAALLKVWRSLKRVRRSKHVLCPVITPGGTIEAELPFTCIANIVPAVLGQITSVSLRDITNDKDENVHAGEQDGKALPVFKEHVTFCDPNGKGSLPLIPVLNTDASACGMNRLSTTKQEVPSQLRGRLAVFVDTTKGASPPSLFMVWIPDNLDASKVSVEIDFHVGFHAQPSGAGDSTAYPLGIEKFKKPDGTEGKRQPYIVKGFEQIMWRTWGHYQHDLAQRACVYVAPIAPDGEMFTKLTAATLGRRLQQVAELVRDLVAPVTHFASVSIGRVALSGFSRGGAWLSTVLSHAGGAAGEDFLKRKVKEVYLFDPQGDSPEAIRTWQSNSNGAILRVYTGSTMKYEAYRRLVDSANTRERSVRFSRAPAGEAREVNSSKGSVVFVANSLLAHASNCGSPQFGCAIPRAADAHGWYPQFFLAHALNNSGFSSL